MGNLCYCCKAFDVIYRGDVTKELNKAIDKQQKEFNTVVDEHQGIVNNLIDDFQEVILDADTKDEKSI